MTYLYAFLIGGGICVIGQILMDATKLTAPRVLVEAVTGGIKAAAGGITVAIGWGYLIALVFNPKSVR